MASLALKVIGIAGVASYAVAYVCLRLRHIGYHRFHVVAIAADRLPAMPKGFAARVVGPEELAAQSIDVDQAEQARRFAGGLECLAVFDRSAELAGVTWLKAGDHHDPGMDLHFVLPGGAAWDTGMWVPPDKRMGRGFAALWAATGEWLRDRDLAWSVSTIADYNVPSLLAHRRLGALELGTYLALTIGSRRLTIGGPARWRLWKKGEAPEVPLQLPATVTG